MDNEDFRERILNDLMISGVPPEHTQVVLSAVGVKRMIKDHGKAMAKDLADTKAKNLQLESALKEMQAQLDEQARTISAFHVQMNEMESVLESKVSSVQLAAKTAEVVDSYTDKFLTSKEFEKQLKISTQAIEEKIAEKAGISQLQKLIEEVSKELEEKVSVTEFVTEMKKQLKLKVGYKDMEQYYSKDDSQLLVSKIVSEINSINPRDEGQYHNYGQDTGSADPSSGMDLLRSI
mmetsp:Transcript_19068/g.36433  ORF Transcript_19068/g.36433 Transcript_19068/m.36433 type:complete len:235 (+) Transcript_19068:92-796(+)